MKESQILTLVLPLWTLFRDLVLPRQHICESVDCGLDGAGWNNIGAFSCPDHLKSTIIIVIVIVVTAIIITITLMETWNLDFRIRLDCLVLLPDPIDALYLTYLTGCLLEEDSSCIARFPPLAIMALCFIKGPSRGRTLES